MHTTDTSLTARSQCGAIRDYLLTHDYIDADIALSLCGCRALSQRCGNLRGVGAYRGIYNYDIVPEPVSYVSAEGRKVRYNRYRMARPAEQLSLAGIA